MLTRGWYPLAVKVVPVLTDTDSLDLAGGNSPMVSIYDEAGGARLLLGAGQAGAPFVHLRDARDRTRMGLGVAEGAGASLILFDREGKPIWRLPAAEGLPDGEKPPEVRAGASEGQLAGRSRRG